jgi:hypothetical protein
MVERAQKEASLLCGSNVGAVVGAVSGMDCQWMAGVQYADDWQTCPKTSANVWMLVKRESGSFARAVSTTCSTAEGRIETLLCKGGGEAWLC